MFMFRFKMFGYLTAGVPSNDNKSNNPHYIFYFLANLLCAEYHICQINKNNSNFTVYFMI